MVSNVLWFLVAGFAASACLVPAARWLSEASGLVARPKPDRWSVQPVGKLGGIAMALAFGLVAGIGGLVPALWPLLLTSLFIVALGFLDDVFPVGPATTLVGQMIVTALLIHLMPSFAITGHQNIDPMLGFLWVVGLTNAFNLLDNIDGLAAGIAAITATFLTATLLLDGAPGLVPLALALAAFVGVTSGFLVFNFHPASIFMGDSGSHLLGFVISAGALLALPHLRPETLVPVALQPIIILLIPIFHTTFVTITRGLSRRSIFAGGRDHTSHRLVALGIGERRAVLVLYALAVMGGLLSLGFRGDEARYVWGLTTLYAGLLVGMGIFLGHVDALRQDTERAPHHPLPSELTNRYRILEVAIDALLIATAYFLAFAIRFGDPKFDHFLQYFARSLPLVLSLQLAGLTIAGTTASFGDRLAQPKCGPCCAASPRVWVRRWWRSCISTASRDFPARSSSLKPCCCRPSSLARARCSASQTTICGAGAPQAAWPLSSARATAAHSRCANCCRMPNWAASRSACWTTTPPNIGRASRGIVFWGPLPTSTASWMRIRHRSQWSSSRFATWQTAGSPPSARFVTRTVSM